MAGKISPLAGKPVTSSMLVNVPKLTTAYFALQPDPAIPAQKVAFGTSGHRGSAFDCAFNEAHILAITQAICLYRKMKGTDGPLFVGIDTHALSEPALASAVEVLAANGVTTMLDGADSYTPTPLVSYAILTYNHNRKSGLADGIVITPSHNPPEDGGFKYNPPHGGPADVDATGWIEKTANELIKNELRDVRRLPYSRALQANCTHRHDYIGEFTGGLSEILDMDAIRSSGVKIGINPLGGASAKLWQPIIDRYGLTATVVNDQIDPTFRFMTADWDGKIRMDCSSPYAMAGLIAIRDKFDIAFANDTDADRHGIVSPSAGLMNPNAYLTAAISWLYRNRSAWRADLGIGKTVVSSSSIDRLAAQLGRPLLEVPVGFKWFVPGLFDGNIGFGGEESAGASFLRKNGTVWTTDKDGIVMALLAAEITARSGRDPGELYAQLTIELGHSWYERIDAPANSKQKTILKNLSPRQVNVTELAGEPVRSVISNAPGNGEPIGGIKIAAENGWFAARPSGTEEVYKIYAESFRSEDHLKQIQTEAQSLLMSVFAQA
ncbi:MAG: phosphoglucomutase (alpha-D-glucose-1,6-bisphosphate-dependent) [Alphaproteobacteria bacterium]|nr:phosphoglucomutase (alpha-D-glucose-1,6-bisphosphate-dependent) [Alphaproteobacteria bacterium]